MNIMVENKYTKPAKGSYAYLCVYGFPAAYADAQMDYFKSGKGSETEKLVAGSPEYAFNEYLRIFLEQGIFGGVLFLLLTILIIRSGIRNKQTGAAGSFMALSVFAFASYPYYLWEFLVMWVILGTVCVSKTEKSRRKKMTKQNIYTSVLFLGVLLAGTFLCVKHLQPYHKAKKEWEKIRPLHTMRAYQSVVDDYARLYPTLNHNQKFVFEYAVALNAVEQREKTDSVLHRGLQLSCDPMFYNVRGRNYHEMGKYEKAEECYLNSICLLPERIYPYYLLTKLYADPANYQPLKMRQTAHAVLEKEPKVHSTAINEMRDEVVFSFILLRILVFGSYKIPTDSMEPTIIPGDYVLVNKLAYGARLFDLFDAMEGKKVNIRRVSGYTRIKNNDVIVFHIPHPNTWDKIEMDMSRYFIKRCIGIPGDTLQIVDGFYVINSDTTKKYGNIVAEQMLNRMTRESLPDGVYHTFPWDSTLNWNIKDLGPLYIPRIGDKITLNRTNILLYKKIIEWEKGYPLTFEKDTLWDKSIPLPSYIFSHNYYFMGGDKVQNSQDSRYWGLLPDDLVVGKASFIWKSKEPYSGKIRWNRILKKIGECKKQN